MDNIKSTTPAQFLQYLEDGDVSKVEIVNKYEAKVYLTKEAQEKEVHKKTKSTSFLSVGSPNYTFEFGDLQNFENQINTTIADRQLNTVLNYKTEHSIWAEILPTLIFFALFIGVWLFIMRKMSAGGGGGAGGQIFNIGKSKAKLFDQNTEVKTSFKDVAGLEGAKEEVQEIVDFLKNPEKYTSLGGKNSKGSFISGTSWNR